MNNVHFNKICDCFPTNFTIPSAVSNAFSIQEHICKLNYDINVLSQDIETAINSVINYMNEQQEEIATIKTQISKINEYINDINSQINNINTDIQQIQDTIGDMQITINQHTTDISDLQLHVSNINKQLGQLEQELTTINTNLTDVTNRVTSIEDNDLPSIRTSLAKAHQDIYNLQQAFTSMSTAIRQITAQVGTNTQNISQLRTDLGNQQTTIDDHTSSINTLNTKVSSLEEQTSDNAQDITNLQNNYTTLAEQVHNIQLDDVPRIEQNANNIAALDTRVTALEQGEGGESADITKLKSDVAALEEWQDTVQTEDIPLIRKNSQNIVEIKQVNTEQQNTLDTHTTEISSNEGRIDSLETTTETLTTQVQTLSNDNETLTTAVNNLNTNVSTNTTDITNLKTENETQQEEIGVAQDEINNNMTAIAEVKTRIHFNPIDNGKNIIVGDWAIYAQAAYNDVLSVEEINSLLINTGIKWDIQAIYNHDLDDDNLSYNIYGVSINDFFNMYEYVSNKMFTANNAVDNVIICLSQQFMDLRGQELRDKTSIETMLNMEYSTFMTRDGIIPPLILFLMLNSGLAFKRDGSDYIYREPVNVVVVLFPINSYQFYSSDNIGGETTLYNAYLAIENLCNLFGVPCINLGDYSGFPLETEYTATESSGMLWNFSDVNNGSEDFYTTRTTGLRVLNYLNNNLVGYLKR